jgi:hypothetical protein
MCCGRLFQTAGDFFGILSRNGFIMQTVNDSNYTADVIKVYIFTVDLLRPTWTISSQLVFDITLCCLSLCKVCRSTLNQYVRDVIVVVIYAIIFNCFLCSNACNIFVVTLRATVTNEI